MKARPHTKRRGKIDRKRQRQQRANNASATVAQHPLPFADRTAREQSPAPEPNPNTWGDSAADWIYEKLKLSRSEEDEVGRELAQALEAQGDPSWIEAAEDVEQTRLESVCGDWLSGHTDTQLAAAYSDQHLQYLTGLCQKALWEVNVFVDTPTTVTALVEIRRGLGREIPVLEKALKKVRNDSEAGTRALEDIIRRKQHLRDRIISPFFQLDKGHFRRMFDKNWKPVLKKNPAIAAARNRLDEALRALDGCPEGLSITKARRDDLNARVLKVAFPEYKRSFTAKTVREMLRYGKRPPPPKRDPAETAAVLERRETHRCPECGSTCRGALAMENHLVDDHAYDRPRALDVVRRGRTRSD